MKKAELIIISGDKSHTEFMRYADVFEKCKTLGTMNQVTMTFKDDMTFNKCHLSTIIDKTKEILESNGDIVSFIHILWYQNDGKPISNPEIQTISDGRKWTRFIDIIKHLGLPCEHDERFFIKNIG